VVKKGFKILGIVSSRETPEIVFGEIAFGKC
jgi:hypothetical protein